MEEAQAAHSKKDFIAKLEIAAKEARETRYWLRLFDSQELLADYQDYKYLREEIEEIIKILNSILISTKNNLRN